MQLSFLFAARIVLLLSLILSPFGAFIVIVTQVNALGPAPASPLAITEILPNALDENTGEIIEVQNTSSVAVDLAQWFFADTTTTTQSFIAFPAQLPIGASQTQLAPGQIALVLDKDYTGEYNAQILATVPAVHVVLVTTSKGNLSLANTTDRIALVDGAGGISDEFSWTSDTGSETPFSRILKSAGGLSALTADPEGLSLGFLRNEVLPEPALAPSVRLSEALPNPADSDTSEFIEVENFGSETVSLGGLTIKDASGKEFELSGELPALAYKSFSQGESGITLNNDSEKVQLWFMGGEGLELLDDTAYENADEGESWSRFEQGFTWTISATPNASNILTAPEQPEPTVEEKEDPDDETASQEEEVESVGSIAEAKAVREDEVVQLEGIVATRVGNFFENNLHLIDASGGILVRIPESFSATIGQKLRIKGARAKYRLMPRIEVSEVEDIEVIGDGALSPIKKSVHDISQDDVGSLVQMSGKVVKRSGTSFRLGNSEKDLLISVRSSSGITKKAPAKDTNVTVTGIILASGENVVLAPRSDADLSGKALLKSGPAENRILFGTSAFLAAVLTMLWERRRAEWLGRSRSSAYRDDQ
jgi:uncharacterized protein YdeI (BOF family)